MRLASTRLLRTMGLVIAAAVLAALAACSRGDDDAVAGGAADAKAFTIIASPLQ